jgi:pimeloyl-ACP methyl ester carboxylesterase
MLPIASLLRPRRLALAALATGVVSFGLAYRFALQYRARVGLPHRSPVEGTPGDFGLEFENVHVPCGDVSLTAWWIPADRGRGKDARPAVAIVHGWESNRGRSLAHARYLHAAGFHVLAIDAIGHGDNPPEELAMSYPEFAASAAAAARWLEARSDVSDVALLGHSMGGAGVVIAAAADPAVRAVVAMSSPADLVRLTRKTFTMADVRVPAPAATPLAYLTAAIMLVARHHSIEDADTCLAASRYREPLLLFHGEDDNGVPVAHMDLIAQAARETRKAGAAPVETMVVPGYGHRWLYEQADVRRTVAGFLARSLGGPVSPKKAGDLAAACVVERPENPVFGFGASSEAQIAAAQERERTRRVAREAPARKPKRA